MQKVTVMCVGKLKEKFYAQAAAEYVKRLSRFCSLEILELAEEVACQLNSQVFPTKIRRGVGVAMAPAHGQSVLTYRPSSNPAQDLQRIVSIVAGDQFPLAEKI